MLTRIALRICVQEALRGRTAVGANVLDSQFSALDLDHDGNLRTEQDRPFASVYTEEGQIAASGGLELLGVSSVALVIEAGIASSMGVEDPESGIVQMASGLPDTDAGMEFTLDLIMHQVAHVLSCPGEAWADLARSFLHTVARIERARIGSKSNGVRIAGHELKIFGQLAQDPLPGQDLAGTTFGQFMDALANSGRPDLVKIRDALDLALAGDAPDYRALQQLLGWSDADAAAMGIGPHAFVEPGDDPVIADVTVERAR